MAVLKGGRERFRPLADNYRDIVLAGVMSVAAVLEAMAEAVGRPGGRVALLTLLATLPLAWRRRWPIAVMIAVFLGAAISRQAAYAEITCAAIAAYSVGAHEKRRLIGLLELTAIAFLVMAIFGGRLPALPDFVGPFVVLLPLWLLGNAIRQGRARAAELSERAARLEREQELTLKAAQAEERARIARELHDVVAHSVSVMVVQAGAARQVLDQSPESAAGALTAVEETGREAMQELRRILGVLGESEPDLAPQPALTQVQSLVATVRRAGLPVDLKVRGEARPLTPGLELTAYRIIQEALTNAVKHSGLAPTHVAIDYRSDELKVEILCDCVQPQQLNGAEGRGLSGMKERVALIGGRIDAGPGIESGYNVRAWLPVGGE